MTKQETLLCRCEDITREQIRALYASDIAVTDGAKIRVEKTDCRDAGLYNVVEVLTKDANGKYLAITKRSGEKGSNANEADYLYWIGN